MDAFARGLKNAARMIGDGVMAAEVAARYAGWDEGIGKQIEEGTVGFEEMEAYSLENGEPELRSGQQEKLENILNTYI